MHEGTPETCPRLTRRLCAGAVGALFFLDEREVRVHLLPKLVVEAVATEHVPQTSEWRHQDLMRSEELC